jgi:antitoxin HicB
MGRTMLKYPITLDPDSNGTLLVGFPDFPTVNTVGDDEADALRNAVDALETALQVYFDGRQAVPLPSAAKPDQRTIALPALSEAKILIWNEMFAQKLRKADLARLLGVHTPQVDRLFDLDHASKLDFVEQAAKVLGKELNVALI